MGDQAHWHSPTVASEVSSPFLGGLVSPFFGPKKSFVFFGPQNEVEPCPNSSRFPPRIASSYKGRRVTEFSPLFLFFALPKRTMGGLIGGEGRKDAASATKKESHRENKVGKMCMGIC